MSASLEGLLRDNLRGYAAYRAGTSADEVRRRFGLTQVVKLSQNENPLGSSPRALAALASVTDYSEYVEDEYLSLRERLAARVDLAVENVLIGNGSNELVQLVCQTFVGPGDEVVMAAPSFALFKKDTIVADGKAIEVPLREGVHDLRAMQAAVTPRTKVVFVCDPNNPTGTRVARADLERFAAALRPDVLLVLDQAYREYMDPEGTDGVAIVRTRPTTVVLRTTSKIYGLAALRFGYAYGGEEAIGWLWRVRLPFNVSRAAATAAMAAFEDDAFVARSLASNERGKVQLTDAFARLGLAFYPSATNFIAVAVPTSGDQAYADLLERGIIVRSGDGLAMPNCLRVTIGTAEQNAAFIGVLTDLLPRWRGVASATR